jgi:hypothetical protein
MVFNKNTFLIIMMIIRIRKWYESKVVVIRINIIKCLTKIHYNQKYNMTFNVKFM